MTLPEFVHGRGVGLFNLLQEPPRFVRIWPHPSIPAQAWPGHCTDCPSCRRPGASDPLRSFKTGRQYTYRSPQDGHRFRPMGTSIRSLISRTPGKPR